MRSHTLLLQPTMIVLQRLRAMGKVVIIVLAQPNMAAVVQECLYSGAEQRLLCGLHHLSSAAPAAALSSTSYTLHKGVCISF